MFRRAWSGRVQEKWPVDNSVPAWLMAMRVTFHSNSTYFVHGLAKVATEQPFEIWQQWAVVKWKEEVEEFVNRVFVHWRLTYP